ncbi:outer membrane beta-barrel protein [Ochrovirga pacifica]|uniref:outer membrane beta-barrel protein n=1 Tax=Ochrovirga pacifica TaxID=1042376 RepID=UPI00025597EE|nr:outer membrane beta-barrel protein [Ochrovirga pacifica]
MNSEDLEKLYQEKLKDLEMTPPKATWQRIEASLLQQQRAKKRGFIWFTSVGSVAAVFIFWFLFTTTDSTVSLAQQQSQKTKKNAFKKTSPEQNTKKATKSLSSEKTALTNKKKAVVVTSKSTYNNSTLPVSNIKTPQKNNTKQPKHIVAITPEPSTNISKQNREQEATKELNFLTIASASKTATTNQPKEKKALVASENDVKTTVKKESFWSIAPVISQYVYQSFSNQSTLDNRLDNSEKQGESSTAYGFNIAYQISKRIKIKSGIHKISMSQSTNNLAINTFSRTSSYQNTRSISSRDKLSNQTVPTSESLSRDIVPVQKSAALFSQVQAQSILEQRLGYVEIPLEINYGLFVNNQFSFYLAGGISTLFLTNNQVIEQTDLFEESFEANNINPLNFSLNFGTDIEYHFSKKWFINLNPAIKIQTQTFSRDNNRPYLLGISTGVNYKF